MNDTDNRNLQQVDVVRPLLWLITGTQRYAEKYRQVCETKIPWMDHVQTFIDHGTGQRILRLQPYASASRKTSPLWLLNKVERTRQIIRDSQEFARVWGLKVEFRDSFYSPQRCILVEYTCDKGERNNNEYN